MKVHGRDATCSRSVVYNIYYIRPYMAIIIVTQLLFEKTYYASTQWARIYV